MGHGNQSKHRNMKLLSDFHIRDEKTNEALREVSFLLGCACVREECQFSYRASSVTRGTELSVTQLKAFFFLCRHYMYVESLRAKCSSVTEKATRKYRLYVENPRTRDGPNGLHVLPTFLSGGLGKSCFVGG